MDEFMHWDHYWGKRGEKAELLSAFCSVYVKEYDYELMQ